MQEPRAKTQFLCWTSRGRCAPSVLPLHSRGVGVGSPLCYSSVPPVQKLRELYTRPEGYSLDVEGTSDHPPQLLGINA